jgi:hypothetical protein
MEKRLRITADITAFWSELMTAFKIVLGYLISAWRNSVEGGIRVYR